MSISRRGFLSMISVGAISAAVPKKECFFLDGLWRGDDKSIVADLGEYSDWALSVDEVWATLGGTVIRAYRIGRGAMEIESTPFQDIPFL